MIRHIVLFKLKNFDSEIEKSEVLNTLKSSLDGLKSKIPEIQQFEVGINLKDSPNAFDLGLNSEFLSLNDLEKYRVHPEHVKVVELIRKHTSDRVVVDYEL